MEIKIYIDVLFVFNLLLNYLVLCITGLLLKMRVKKRRLLLVSALGALYAVLSFFAPDSYLYSLFCKLLMGALMALIAFKPAQLKIFIKYVCAFYATVFVLGGMAFAFFYFSDSAASLGAVYRNGTLYINLPVYLLLPLCFLCYGLLSATFAVGKKLSGQHQQIYKIRFVYRGNSHILHAYYDSGNLLTEKKSGTGVIVAEWESIRRLFPRTTFSELSKKQDITNISYRTLQGRSFLPAFLPDKMYIEGRRRICPISPFYIGLVNQTLDYYHKWDAVLPHTFKGEENYEKYMDSPIAEHSQTAGLSHY